MEEASESSGDSLGFFSTSNTASHALTALQGYGPTTWSPSCTTNNPNAESSLTASNTASPFSNLNLNSVEEEDAFLYGDSNSVPEEQKGVENDSVISNTDRLDTAWSDEDDPFVKTPATTVTDLNPKLTKHLSDSNSQNKIQDIVKLPKVEKEENLIEDTAFPLEISNKACVSHKLESHGSVLSPVIEKNEFPQESSVVLRYELQNTGRVDTAWSDEEDPFVKTSGITIAKERNLIEDVALSLEISNKTCMSPKVESRGPLLSPVIEKNEFSEANSAVVDQSQYPIANELFKKQIDEENVINITTNKALSIFPETSKHVSDHEGLSTDLKTAKSAVKRRNPKVINKKHIDNIRDYITRGQRERGHPSEESPVEKPAKYMRESASPARHHSGDRFSLPGRQYKSSDHTKYKLSYSSHRSPSLDSGCQPPEELPVKKHETPRSFSPSRRHSPHRSSLPDHKSTLSKREETSYSSYRSSHFVPVKRPSRYTESHRRYSPSPEKWSPNHDYRDRKRSCEKYYNRHSFSPSRHHSPNRSSSPRHKPKSSKRGRESSYSSHRSPSFGLKEWPPGYSERYTRDSSSPKKRSHSPGYRHSRRSSEKSTHYTRHKDRRPRSFRSRCRSPRSSRSRSPRSFRSKPRRPRSFRSRSRSPRSLRSISRSPRSLRSISRSSRSLRSRSRSRRSCSSRFKSPGYYPISTKTCDKKKIRKLPKKSGYCSKKKERSPFSSSNSFCSLSLDSSSSSCCSSDESSDERSFKSNPVKVVSKNNSLLEDELINFNGCYTYSKKSDSPIQRESISKSLSDTCNVKNNDENRLNSVSNHPKLDAVLPSSSNEQLLMNFREQQLIIAPDSSTSTSAAVIDIDVASDMQIPVISSSESYDYPTIPPLQVTDFPQMTPAGTFSAPVVPTPPPTATFFVPVMPTPPPTEYNPYFQMPPIPSNVVSKSRKVRHSTLRTVPLSDSLNSPPASSSNVTGLKDFPLQEPAAKSKTQESLQPAEQSSEKKPTTLKEKKAEESVSSSSDLIMKNTSEKKKYIEQKRLIAVAKFKKIKAEKCRDIYKAKSGSYLDEMKRMKSSNQGRKEDLVKDKNEDTNEQKKNIKGAEFVKCVNGFYCVLCKEIFVDKPSSEQHLEGHQHFANYDSFIKEHPTYEQDDNKNLDLINEDLNKELHNGQIKIHLDSNKEKTVKLNAEAAHENKSENKIDSTSKTKKPKLPEASKDVHSDNSSETENSSETQTVLSGEQAKNGCCSHCDKCRKGVEKKIVHKYIFIGKCPGYKKKSAEKNKPRDTGESIVNKSENNSGDINDKEGLEK